MVLAAQMTGCVMAVFLGLLILVSMLSNMYDFGCRCLLFTAGQYGDDGEFAPAWASLGYCVYVVCMASVIICWGAWLAHKSFKQLRYDAVPSFSEALWDSIACLSVTLIALVGAFFVTFGYEEWCRNITKRFSTCSDATHNQIDTKDNINTENFYLQIGIAQVGSLNACYLAQKDLDVHVFEYRGDIRTMEHVQGRSINLALSERGRAALRHVAMETAVVSSHGIPMYARMIHDVNGRTRKIPYGKANQCIYSVGRRYLNETLITEAEKYNNVHFHFNHKLQHCDLENGELTFANGVNEHFDLILGCDGAYSSVRRQMMKLPRFNYSQHYIEHGYMELCIPPMANGEFAMEPNYLHIWPRGRFMMIALPNQDHSWTVTLFMPFATYETLTTTNKLMAFFEANYRDSIELIGREKLVQDFFGNTLLPMVSIKCSPYHVTDKALIMGDAAHAMVPFYGQGMNAGFEDCLILHEMMTSHSMKLDRVLSEYSEYRQPDAEAICDLAMYNYIEMRDLVNSRAFLLRKYLDNMLNSVLSSLWTPLYTMVAFTRIRYHEAIAKKRQQDSIVRSLLFLIPGVAVALAVLNYHQTESGFFSMNDHLIKLFQNNFQLFQTNVK